MFPTMILGCTSCRTEQENIVQHHHITSLWNLTGKYQHLYWACDLL